MPRAARSLALLFALLLPLAACRSSKLPKRLWSPPPRPPLGYIEMTVAGKERAAQHAGRKVDLEGIKTHVDVLPFLVVELDGNVFTQIEEARLETFLLQAQRLADHMRVRRNSKRKRPD